MTTFQISHSDKIWMQIEAALQETYLREQLPSISAVIVYQQQVIWAKSYGYANLVEKRAADVQTIYEICSITKIFTAILLLQLRDAGKLQLDDLVEWYLPELKRLQSATPITFRQLASHTAGLPTMPPLPGLAQIMQEFPPRLETLRQMTFPSSKEILDLLPEVVLVGTPGTQVVYSNLGIALLAHTLERIVDQPYIDYVTEHILQPLGMMNSGFALHKLPATNLATCYLPFDSPPLIAPSEMKDIKGFTGAGALHASVSDMARFLNFLAGAHSNTQRTPLSVGSFHEMLHPVAHLNASHYTNKQVASGVGIGWFLSSCHDHAMIEHGGADPSTAAYLAYVPDLGLGVFTATNSGSNPTAIAVMAYEFLERLIPHILIQKSFVPFL